MTAATVNLASHPTTALPRLRTAHLDDYPHIARLESAHGLLSLPAQDWRGIWLNHPLARRRADAWPIGWVLEDDAGRIVGALTNIPSAYQFKGRELIAATGRGWVVAPEHRGSALWLMDEFMNQSGADLFVNTTVNALAAEAHVALGSLKVPVGDWQSAAYWVTSHVGFARCALRIKGIPLDGLLSMPAGACLKLKDLLINTRLPPGASALIEEASCFNSRFDAFWQELVRQNPNKLLGARDSQTLTWHFGGALRAGKAWILTVCRGSLLCAYAVFKRQDHPQSGLRRMRLVDFQNLDSGQDVLSGMLRHALRRCSDEGIHTLEQVGCDLPKSRLFDQCAPYRRKLPAWAFYYKAVDPALETELQAPDAWDPSTFDGDASL